jgi:hypothetical protein
MIFSLNEPAGTGVAVTEAVTAVVLAIGVKALVETPQADKKSDKTSTEPTDKGIHKVRLEDMGTSPVMRYQ